MRKLILLPFYITFYLGEAYSIFLRVIKNKYYSKWYDLCNREIDNKFLEMVKTECDSKNEKVKPYSKEFNYYLDILYKFTGWIEDKSKIEKDDVSAAANDYLKTLGYVSLAYSWIKVLDVSFNDYESNKEFYEDKINTAKFYFDKVLPRAEFHYKSAISGSSNIMNFKFN